MHPSIDSKFETAVDQAEADEGTCLLPQQSPTPSPSSANPPTPPTSTAAVGKRAEHARHILLSTTLSRVGSRSWEFAAPLLLLEWSPGSLAAPAALGLACALARTTVSPWLGGRADTWSSRMDVVAAGAAMQAVGCSASVGALVAWNALAKADGTAKLTLLVAVICAGVVETLGAQLASVAVKKEWVPIVFDEDGRRDDRRGGDGDADRASADAAFGRGRSPFSTVDPPHVSLSFINTAMTNIDLICAMFGPVLAGWILEAMAGRRHSTQRGFAAIALLNVFSFVPEMILLRRVYRSCPALRQREHGEGKEAEGGSDQTPARTNPWIVWFRHPSGLPLLSLSLASLYLTALSPSGVVLTAYLVTIGLSPASIGIFRAIGSFSGVVGIGLFSMLRARGGDEGDCDATERAERSASVRSIERLRRASLAFLLLEVFSVAVAAVAHFLCEESHLISSTSLSDEAGGGSPPWQIVLFLSAIVVSRAGLYSFDVGALEIEQHVVDERYRNAVGSVEGALCSLAEMGMYVLSIALPDPADFGWQVCVSAAAVAAGGVCFGSFLCLYHMHPHHHHDDVHDDEGVDDHHDHSHQHRHNHAHTRQQERDLKEFGYHVHLHRSSPSLPYRIFKNRRR